MDAQIHTVLSVRVLQVAVAGTTLVTAMGCLFHLYMLERIATGMLLHIRMISEQFALTTRDGITVKTGGSVTIAMGN
jgi:hypothetical protein